MVACIGHESPRLRSRDLGRDKRGQRGVGARSLTIRGSRCMVSPERHVQARPASAGLLWPRAPPPPLRPYVPSSVPPHPCARLSPNACCCSAPQIPHAVCFLHHCDAGCGHARAWWRPGCLGRADLQGGVHPPSPLLASIHRGVPVSITWEAGRQSAAQLNLPVVPA